MTSRKLLLPTYIVSALLLVATGYRCTDKKPEETGSASDSKWLNVNDTVSYVGMNTCRRCHEDKFETFIHTGMGESFGLANPQKSAGKYPPHQPLYDKYRDLYYLPYWKDTALMLKEFRIENGDTTYSRTEHIDYIIGSGQHTNSHIVNQNGYLYQAPFTFYTQSGKLDFPPGFENGNNTRFGRALNEECLTCHNGYPVLLKGSFNKYTSVPLGIDCERCHGPGSLHVQQKLAGNIVNTSHDTDFSIVNPRKLPQELQLDVCQRCHLQGDAVLKEGKTFFDHKPGKRLSATMNVFRPVYENEDKFIMASHAERMQMSPCYLQTLKNKGTFTCVTCHNPHVSVRVTDVSVFTQKCQGCHKTVHNGRPEWKTAKKETNCITCHMPRNGTTDIPHVTVTDHYIHVVKKGEKQRTATKDELGAFKHLACLTESNPDNLTKAKAFMYLFEKYDRQVIFLDSALRLLSVYKEKDQPEAYINYYYQRNDFRSITGLLAREKPALKTAIANYQAGKGLENLQADAQALPYFQKTVDMLPYELNYRIQLGTTLMKLRRFDEAEQQFDFVIKENPKIAPAWNDKGFACLAKAQLAFSQGKEVDELINLAERYFEKALSLDPDHAEAHLNMAKVWDARGDINKAKEEIQAVLRRDPKNTAALELMSRLPK